MDLYLLRHGDYLQHDKSQGLSPKGKNQIRSVANLLSNLGITFDVIISSQKKRALETTAIVAQKIHFSLDDIIQTDSLNPSTPAEEAVSFIQNFSNKQSVLVVGHLPCLNEIAGYILAKEAQLMIRFDQGTICKLQFESFKSANSELTWVIPNSICNLTQII
jgi:phosphohistidine phosphatase